MYFLRRVFEPVISRGHITRVRPTRIRCHLARSATCQFTQPGLRRLRARRLPPEPSAGCRSADLFPSIRGHFALDFAYEDWAVAHREALHAALPAGRRETRLRRDAWRQGTCDRGIVTARSRSRRSTQRLSTSRPRFVRMLRLSGVACGRGRAVRALLSACFEESLGIEPPPLDAL